MKIFKNLVALILGTSAFASVLNAEPQKVPDYKDKIPMYIQDVDSLIKDDMTRVSVIRTYDLNRQDNEKFDVLTFSIRCHNNVNGKIKEYTLSVKDVLNQRLFIYDIFGRLIDTIKGNKDIDNYYGDLPDCPKGDLS